MVTPFLGYMFALGSALCNGSFASLSKCSTEDLSPVYFNSCLSLGVTISSWIFAVAYYDELSDVVLFDPAAAAGGFMPVSCQFHAGFMDHETSRFHGMKPSSSAKPCFHGRCHAPVWSK